MSNSMKKNLIYIVSSVLALAGLSSCNEWLGGTKPTNFLTPEQVWNDNTMIKGVLANLYNAVDINGSLDNDADMSLYDDFMWCGLMNSDVENARNNMQAYSYDIFRYYDYTHIYRINDAIENLTAHSNLDKATVDAYISEFRFLRAYAYFRMVIAMGGVPLITNTSIYESGMDVTELQVPRSSEAQVYDFIYSECMAIKDYLATEGQSRANKYAALALASRAMLYAGSIAKYNAAMANPIKSELQDGVVGMTGANADAYYEKALDAAEEIIEDGVFTLQSQNDPSADNFYKAVCDKGSNTEVIWCKDYSAAKFHNFAFGNIPQSMNEDNDNGSNICPTLQLVESYKLLDGSDAGLADKDADGNYIAYDNRIDIFQGRDHRLMGTCLVPEQVFKGKPLDVLAGVALYKEDGTYELVKGSAANSKYTDDKPFVGFDGPINDRCYTNTGFNLRKYVDEGSGTSARGNGSYIWYVYFRMGEVYLNAAEAAMELGKTETALKYVNAVRERAGFGKDSWTADDLTIENMLNERRCELAVEDHRFWDLKRTRMADKLWNGVRSETTMLYALYPYRVIGGPNDGKYIFDRGVAPRFLAPRNFRRGNYYTSFSTSVLSNNPKLVQNPNV